MNNDHLFGRKADATGRSTTELADSKHRKRNQAPGGEPFIWLTKEMIESPTWRVMSGNARLVVDRIAIEHMSHAGTLNGALPVTFDNFEQFGIRRGSIVSAINEAVAMGFVDLVEKGTRGYGDLPGKPNLFRLSWLPTATGEPANARWRRFQTLASAERAAKQVRQSAAARRAPRKKQEANSIPQLRRAAE
ncbi:hypothetical protein MKK70_16725 [Methylobacterium sp. E-041]|uniref:hypothetical protein n=1 Tax=Methylobacterium sp. E-041 TaxID=2836573 RepID=UPI001FBAAD26|nr:hypothetical protein [Methylobacterium sp. E-041]MCJ2106991.1 hypothetical protein [Methylobacterium sp. E-041]